MESWNSLIIDCWINVSFKILDCWVHPPSCCGCVLKIKVVIVSNLGVHSSSSFLLKYLDFLSLSITRAINHSSLTHFTCMFLFPLHTTLKAWIKLENLSYKLTAIKKLQKDSIVTWSCSYFGRYQVLRSSKWIL